MLYVTAFVCLFMYKCLVIQLSVSYGNLNVCLTRIERMRAHSILNFILLGKREKGELYIFSLESVTSIQEPINLLKVVYHSVSCLLYYIKISNYLSYLKLCVCVVIELFSNVSVIRHL